MDRRVIVLLAFLCIVVGCARQPTYFVTVDALSTPDAQTVKKYVLLPGEKDLSPEDLRFKEFCVYIDRAMASKGFVKVDEADGADIAVLLSYAVTEPKEYLYSYSVPHFGQTGVSSSTTYGNIQSFGNYGTYSGTTTYQPTYGITGYSSHVGTYVTYTRGLSLVACDLDAFKDEQKVREVWRVLAASTGSSGDLRRVFPILVAAARPYLGGNTDKKSVTVKLKEDDEEVLRIRDGDAALTETDE